MLREEMQTNSLRDAVQTVTQISDNPQNNLFNGD